MRIGVGVLKRVGAGVFTRVLIAYAEGESGANRLGISLGVYFFIGVGVFLRNTAYAEGDKGANRSLGKSL